TRSPAASPGRRTASAMTTWARKEFSRNRSSSGTNFAPCSVIVPRKQSSATADRASRRATIFLQWSLPDCAAAGFTPARGASGSRTLRDRAKRVDQAGTSWQWPQRRRRVVGEGQAGRVQDHRHQRVIAAQRKKLEPAVEAEPGDLGRDLPLRFSHCFWSQPWKSRLHSPYYPPCMVADLLLGVHFAIAAFIVGGLVLVWAGAARGWGWVRNPWFRYLHLAAIAFVA